MIFNNIQFFRVIVTWLLKLNVIEDPSSAGFTISIFLDKVELWIKTRGPLNTIQRLKDIRTILYAQVSGSQDLRIQGIAQYASGFPKVFGPQVNHALIEGNQKTIRFCLTLLQVSRLIPAWKPVDLSTITNPGKDITKIRNRWKAVVPILVQTFGPLQESQPIKWSGFHIATTMGPMGPALLTATHCVQRFLEKFSQEALDLGAQPLIEYLSTLVIPEYWWQRYPSNYKNIIRRLSTVPDTDGKTRVIGILDYWSQGILKGIHDELMSILRAFSGPDVTYGQDIGPFGPEDQPYYSMDLTAATDRFPVCITEDLLAAMWGSQIAGAWRRLMTDEGFYWKDRFYKYKVGQPMGAYSSWASFSLTHHMIVQWAAMEAGEQLPFRHYRLLGDDIVIRHSAVAQSYIQILQDLGVEISDSKTLVSANSFEFAKRYFHQGSEATGFPAAGLTQVINRWPEILQVLSEGARRGCDCSAIFEYSNIVRLYDDLRRASLPSFRDKSRKWSKRMARRVMALYWVATRGANSTELAAQWGIQFSCNMKPHTIRLLILECMAQIKANQCLDSVRTQVKRINSYIFDLTAAITQSESPQSSFASENPVVLALRQNFMDQQGQMENLRDLGKTQDFETIVFENPLIPDINPEELDSSRRSLRMLERASSMAVRAMVLLRNARIEQAIELGSPDIDEEALQ